MKNELTIQLENLNEFCTLPAENMSLNTINAYILVIKEINDMCVTVLEGTEFTNESLAKLDKYILGISTELERMSIEELKEIKIKINTILDL